MICIPTIKHCSIDPKPKNIFDPAPFVNVVFSNGSKLKLFQYEPGRITFDENEFLGLTETEARLLKIRKEKQFSKT